jgi:nicotinate-nucleotide pyrophosphorylase (carboxylating)
MLLLNPIREIIELALAEDLAGGDLTTEATVGEDVIAVGRAIAKKPLVVCGADVFAQVFAAVDVSLRVEALLEEGAWAEVGHVLWHVEGSARSILVAERTALNFVQRLSGIATLSRRFVDALPEGSQTRIADTRKTTPGLRYLERYAVRTGGAYNHRDMLGSAVLIKDNHIEASGGIAIAIERARKRAPHTCRIEIEVESLDQLQEALAARADIVMLDNFAESELELAVALAKGKALVEISGGVSLDRISVLAARGIDVISVGALTHSAPAADISLDIERLGG